MSLFYDNGGFQKHFDLLSVKSLLTVDYADSVLSSVSNLAALQVISLTVFGIGFNAGHAGRCIAKQEYYRLLQADIEAYPWCYLWSHKRWKR